MEPKLCYLVCSTQRSGSNLLCQLLQFSGVAGNPEEYFAPEFYDGYAKGMLELERFPDSFREFLQKIVAKRTTPNGVFGAKMMRSYIGDFCARIRADRSLPSDDSDPSLLRATFPNLAFIWLRRRNKLRQAISMIRAQSRNSYVSSDEHRRSRPVEIPRDTFDYGRLKSLVHGFELADREWERFFEEGGIEPIRIDYEDLVPAISTAVPAVITALGIELPEGYEQPEARHRKQSDELTEDWHERYLAMRQEEALEELRAEIRSLRRRGGS